MRVLVITAMYPSLTNPVSGIFIKRQLEALRAQGVDIILAKAVGPVRRNLVGRYSRLAWETLSARHDFDVVHVHYPTAAGVYGGLIARARRRPLVLTLHGGELDQAQYADLHPTKQWLTRLSATWALRQASAVIAVSKALADLAVRAGVPAHKITTIDMGVDLGVFYPRPKEQASRFLGLSPAIPRIVSAGALISIKGPEHVIRAACLLREQRLFVEWRLVGAGAQEPYLRALIHELGVSEQVHLAGECAPEAVAWWDAAADVFVMPSLAEGWGLAALEAMACGRPVVASRVGGLPDFVRDGWNGFLVPPADPHAIANRVQDLLADSNRRRTMGQNGIKTAREHDVHLQAAKVLAIYRAVAEKKGLECTKTPLEV